VKSSQYRSVAFGFRWESDIPLSLFEQEAANDLPADIVVRRARANDRSRDVLIGIDNAELCSDGVRFRVGREVMFDVIGSDLIEWSPGAAWAGKLPAIFFGTITAILLAWRGCVPIHGSTVEINGEAILICGASGAGKSTMSAGMIALGAKFISDDLSVIRFPESPDAGMMFLGRPGLRLFPQIAEYFKEACNTENIAAVVNAGEKSIVFPPHELSLKAIPLKLVIMLVSSSGSIEPTHKAAFLQGQLYHPKWMANIPGFKTRMAHIMHLANQVDMLAMPPTHVCDPESFIGFAASAINLLERGRR
jgi:hypothetical protein